MQALILRIDAQRITPTQLQTIQELFAAHPGHTRISLRFIFPTWTARTDILRDWLIEPTDELLFAIQQVLGPGTVEFTASPPL